jgi:hypothetical protein
MNMTEQEERLTAVRLAHALMEHPGVAIEMSGHEAWVLLGALQWICRQQALEPELRARIAHIARTVQHAFDAVPWVAELAARGWDPAYDVATTRGEVAHAAVADNGDTEDTHHG